MWLFKGKRKYLEYILDRELDSKDVQAGYPTWSGINEMKLPKEPGVMEGVTWCNRYVERVLRLLGYRVDDILKENPVTKKPDIGWTTANRMIQLARDSRHLFQVPERVAQGLANMGTAVLIGSFGHNKSGHVGIVYPHKWNNIMGVFVAQAGGCVGKFFRKDKRSFNVEGIGEPYFFVLRRDRDAQETLRIARQAYLG